MGAPVNLRAGRGRDLDAARLGAQGRAIYGEAHVPEAPPPDGECLWIEEGDAILARCSIGTAHELKGAPGTTGWVGWYEAVEDRPGAALLREACRLLAERGVVRTLGPFHGSTWRRYRLALAERGDDEPFFMGEPRNPFTYPEHFRQAGLSIAATYESRIVSSSGVPEPKLPAGFRAHTAEKRSFEELLDLLYGMSLDTFGDNKYYSPIGREEFQAVYEPLRRLFDPSLVTLVESRAGDVLGFLFAYPDRAREPGPRKLVAKTMAVAPGARGTGLGRFLLDEIARQARERGFTEVIHALMYADNRSKAISVRQNSRLYRRYALYEWIS